MAQARKHTKSREPEDKEFLKQYLGQYYRAKKKKRQLEIRLKEIELELKDPRGAIRYSAVPFSVTHKISDGAAVMVIRKTELVERIEAQRKEAGKNMLKVMDVLDFLPMDSNERMILEYRYLDCLSWNRIGCEAAFSRSQCNNYWNAGLDQLLSYKRVVTIVRDYARKKCENIT